MSPAFALRVSRVSLLAAGLLLSAGCASTPASRPAPPAPAAPEVESPAILQARFERLVQQLLDVEPELVAVLDQLAGATEKSVQASVERELLRFLTGEAFSTALKNKSYFTSKTLLLHFTPESAAILKAAGIDRPLLEIVDDLGRLSSDITELAAVTEDGRALQRIFILVQSDVLPAVVETRALITEEHLDANEAAALAQKVEEQLQSITDQLGSLKSRARSVSSPNPPP